MLGAAGEFRGGIRIVRENTFLTDTIITREGERHESDLPRGAFGGHHGLIASLVRNPGREVDGKMRVDADVTAKLRTNMARVCPPHTGKKRPRRISGPERVRLGRVLEELLGFAHLSVPDNEHDDRGLVVRLSVDFGVAVVDSHGVLFPADDVLDGHPE